MIPQMAMKHKPMATPGQKPKWVNAAFRPVLTEMMNATRAALQTTIRDI